MQLRLQRVHQCVNKEITAHKSLTIFRVAGLRCLIELEQRNYPEKNKVSVVNAMYQRIYRNEWPPSSIETILRFTIK